MSIKNKTILTFIVPCYNESKHLNETIEEINISASTLKDDFEILIVDDGSSDKTFLTAQVLKKKYIIRL